MKKTLLLIALTISISTAQGNELFGFLEGAGQPSKEEPVAKLVTLEANESEMYPKVSPDGKYLLTLTGKSKSYWISRRAIQNGTPLNIVTNDLAALGSVAWSNNSISFLSNRTGTLGLWQKPAGGEGLMRRVKELSGKLKDITLLKDGSMIATRLIMHGHDKYKKKIYLDNFNNWDAIGTHSYIVHITAGGSEKRLSEGFHPAISPDGKRIVFSMPVERSIHLFMMDIDGKNLAELSGIHSIDIQPTWSPDGQWVVFTSNRSHRDVHDGKKNQWDIWAVTREGKQLTQLTLDKAQDGAPSVAKDGYVYFHSDRKISKSSMAKHQVSGHLEGFHIWKIPLPDKILPK